MILKSKVEAFFLSKIGYLKKSPLEAAKAIWKDSPKHNLPKNQKELQKELDVIAQVQSDLRRAKTIEDETTSTELSDIYQKIIDAKNRPKRRLFFDIETSPNVVFSWRIGNKINLSHDNIINERAIICVAWRWEGDEKTHSLQWSKGCDKDLLTRFSKIIDSADEIITQNGDKFDVKWLRTRCIYHNIPISVKFNSIDTLKLAKAGFNFNNNRLDYMGQFLGVGQKMETGYNLWRDIILKDSKEAMLKMVTYCKADVELLQRVYEKLQPYCPVKKFKYALK